MRFRQSHRGVAENFQNRPLGPPNRAWPFGSAVLLGIAVTSILTPHALVLAGACRKEIFGWRVWDGHNTGNAAATRHPNRTPAPGRTHA